MRHLGLQRVLQLQALPVPLDRKAEVVGERDERPGPGGVPDLGERLLRECGVLGRDLGEQRTERAGLATVRRDEGLHDLGRVDLLTGAGLEAQPAPGQHNLAATGILRQHDVVVEDAHDLHGVRRGWRRCWR